MANANEVAGRVRELIGIILHRSIGADEEVVQAHEAAWDSLKHMELMLSIEETFNITLDPEDFATMTSVQSCTEQINRRLNS